MQHVSTSKATRRKGEDSFGGSGGLRHHFRNKQNGIIGMHPPQLCWGRQQTPRQALLNAQLKQKGWGVHPTRGRTTLQIVPSACSLSLNNQPQPSHTGCLQQHPALALHPLPVCGRAASRKTEPWWKIKSFSSRNRGNPPDTQNLCQKWILLSHFCCSLLPDAQVKPWQAEEPQLWGPLWPVSPRDVSWLFFLCQGQN